MEPGGLCETHLTGISGSDTPEDTETEDTNPDTGGTALAPAESRQVFVDGLEEAGLDTQRFIDVHDGKKRSTDHTQLAPDANQLSGHYGVYGGAGANGDGDRYLVDVDDYEGESGPDWLPETFTIQSPHTDVSISERQVRDHLTTLAERGYVDRETEGRGYVWEDDGLHEISDTGEVELDVVEDEDVVAEVARKSTYTWEFRNSSVQPSLSGVDHPIAEDECTTDALTNGGCDGPPP